MTGPCAAPTSVYDDGHTRVRIDSETLWTGAPSIAVRMSNELGEPIELRATFPLAAIEQIAADLLARVATARRRQ